ncbi:MULTISPECIES: Fur family transcriptional regulator [unclassified Oleiphilus]|nr:MULTISPECIES: Fur family transcriptional regulator [unclassified Oleiphilus]KZY67070.1 Fur family transcriptional regulator [Oleiphilus sp. HI0066]KZY71529.1 Fur family transcriptional regulator [Oleiphilus sp. HI0067]KZY73273.1 Fur family transcriptional regulator [Oleiphilus sp. HI0067]
MSQINKIINSAEQQCKAKGVRLTDKRKQVLSALIESKKALSAYELVDYLKDEFKAPLPAMSVYRILDFLQTEQLVHKLDIANKYVACAHITCGHDHGTPQFLICNNCNSVTEVVIPNDIIQQLQNNVTDAGYTLESTQIEMSCRCPVCNAQTA